MFAKVVKKCKNDLKQPTGTSFLMCGDMQNVLVNERENNKHAKKLGRSVLLMCVSIVVYVGQA